MFAALICLSSNHCHHIFLFPTLLVLVLVLRQLHVWSCFVASFAAVTSGVKWVELIDQMTMIFSSIVYLLNYAYDSCNPLFLMLVENSVQTTEQNRLAKANDDLLLLLMIITRIVWMNHSIYEDGVFGVAVGRWYNRILMLMSQSDGDVGA